MWKAVMDIQEEVREALAAGVPVVALESTIISHGMPYPENIKTARALEELIRLEGVVPATIGVIDGRIKVGLDEEALERLGQGKDIVKVSRRDFHDVIAQGKSGATTVAGTMIVAQQVGIRVFATGGIGGVHRGYGQVLDISQDLEELSRTNVAVVCAGVKSILDIRSTLEFLETKSVPVYTYGSDIFPAFYTRDSGLASPQRIDDLLDLAKAIRTKWELGLDGGIVLANPIPQESAYDSVEINLMIDQALEEAEKSEITGKDVTPFLLDHIKKATGGRSLDANIALVKNNARVAAKLAKILISI